jgi:hypothetical protein
LQSISKAGVGTIDEMNVVNNETGTNESLLGGGWDSSNVRKYSKCVFISNQCTYFTYQINIDVYDSVFDVNPTFYSAAVISTKDGCSVGGDNRETIDFVDIKTCVKQNDGKSSTSKTSNPIMNMYFLRHIKWLSLFDDIGE